MRNKIIFFSLIIISLFFISVYYNWEYGEILYFKFFKKNGEICHFNNKRQLDGCFIVFKNGKIIARATFKNGQKDGLVAQFYDNERLKNKTYYDHGIANGLEWGYYANGIIDYISNWKDGKYYGSGYHYLNNGQLMIYNCSDIDNLFYYSEYNSSKKITKIIGNLFSPNICLSEGSSTSFVLLDSSKNYHKIRSLYITIATPPQLTERLQVKINNKIYKYQGSNHTTLEIFNPFPGSGIFKLSINGNLIDAEKRIIKSDSLKINIKQQIPPLPQV